MQLIRVALTLSICSITCHAMDQKYVSQVVYAPEMQKALYEKVSHYASKHKKYTNIYAQEQTATDWVVLKNSFHATKWSGKRKNSEILRLLSILKNDPVILRTLSTHTGSGLLPRDIPIIERLGMLFKIDGQKIDVQKQADSYKQDFSKYGNVADVARVISCRTTKIKVILELLLFHDDCKNAAQQLLSIVT